MTGSARRCDMGRWSIGVAVVLGFLAAAAYANWPDNPLPAGTVVDSVLVLKGERKLILLDRGNPVREYRIALGGNPVGPKAREGDRKTPEGQYVIDYRNKNSAFHLALHVSYPDVVDRARASAQGIDPGGLIMIHGIRNKLWFFGRFHRAIDWTNGCIALTDWEIEELWRLVADGTPIEIRS